MVPGPNAATVTISGQSDWKLFDGDLAMHDSGGSASTTKQAPARAYLAVFGPAGSTATVVVEKESQQVIAPNPTDVGGVDSGVEGVEGVQPVWRSAARRTAFTTATGAFHWT